MCNPATVFPGLFQLASQIDGVVPELYGAL